MSIKLSFKVNDDMQTIEQLWESVANLANRRVEDNKLMGEYPLSVRQLQVAGLKSLAQAIEDTHKAMEEQESRT